MVVIFDLIGLLCVYGRALLWSRKRRMNPMETACHHLNVLPSQLLAAAREERLTLTNWLLLCWLAVGLITTQPG